MEEDGTSKKIRSRSKLSGIGNSATIICNQRSAPQEIDDTLCRTRWSYIQYRQDIDIPPGISAMSCCISRINSGILRDRQDMKQISLYCPRPETCALHHNHVQAAGVSGTVGFILQFEHNLAFYLCLM